MKFKFLFTAAFLASASFSVMAQTHIEGEEYFKADQLANAKELLLRNMNNAGTDKAISDYYLGLIAIEEGNASEANKWFTEGTQNNPENAFNYIGLASLELKNGNKQDAAAVAEEQGVAVEKLQPGDVLTLGEEGQGVQVEVLGPARPDEENENNNSLILRVVFGDTAFLLMGDTEEASEERLLDSGVELEADVLKLGHHGKMDATSEELLERVKPAYGIVTANREKEEGSADPRMAERLRAARVQVFYSEGKIRGVDFISDGTEVRVREY